MKKVKPTTKEQLIYFFITNISLGTYDKRFLSNIESMSLIEGKPLTSNQVALLDKIITRYSRQLSKLEINVDEMLALPWNIQPIESLPQFTEAHLNLMEDVFLLHSPYKKEFIDEFKQADIDGKWNKEDRCWTFPACTHSLSIATFLIEKHYNKVNYCDQTKEFINTASAYKDMKYWNPTYKYINGAFYVVATNPYLESAITDLEFNLDLSVLARLVRYGVTIDDTVLMKFSETYSVDEIAFAIDPKPKVEINDDSIIDKLQSIKTDCVAFMELTGSSSNFFKGLKEQLNDTDMKQLTLSTREPVNDAFVDSEYPVLLVSGFWTKSMMDSRQAAKVIHVVNSKPIFIK